MLRRCKSFQTIRDKMTTLIVFVFDSDERVVFLTL